MDGHVWRPHSIVNLSLSKVPFLEEITSVLLMSWMDLGKIDHLLHQISLVKTLVHKEIIFLMHSTVTSLASSLENLESSSKGLRVVSLERKLRWPMGVTVMHTNGVDLLFVTLDTVRGTNVISEKPGFRFFMSTNKRVAC